MRRLLPLIPLLAALAGAGASPAAQAPSPTAFVIAGGGWGHGVGMSQWGAYGQAKAGRDYRAILGHYYSGTELGSAPAAVIERIRVLVGDELPSVTVTSVRAVVDATGERYPIPGGTLTVGKKLELPVGADGAQLVLPEPVTIRALPGTFLTYGGKGFRGDLRVARSGKGLQLVNVVGLEAYLLGVVPGEMPKHWPLEALKAQAVAARTYAVGHLVKGKPFDLYSDSRSQLYYGVGSEAPSTTEAVRSTAGEIVTYRGAPAQTFYFSSSGGRTVSALDAFGSEVPYLVAVDDPWDEPSPNHRWSPQLLTGAQLARRFGLTGAVTEVALVPGAVGRPAALRLTTRAGTRDVRLSDVRARLRLRSTGFRLGVLRLDEPDVAARTAGAVRLTGLARDVRDVALERRGAEGSWALVKRIQPARDGSFALSVRLDGTAVLRLTAEGVSGPALTVRIAA